MPPLYQIQYQSFCVFERKKKKEQPAVIIIKKCYNQNIELSPVSS